MGEAQEASLPQPGQDSQDDLPAYESTSSHDPAPSYDNAPTRQTGTNLTIDPTGLFIKRLPFNDDDQPLYSLSKSMLKVGNTTSIHVKRQDTSGNEVTVFAISDHFISAMHSRKRDFRNIQAARSHGLLVTVGVRKIVWDFITHVPAPKSTEGNVNPSSYPVDPVYMIGTGPGPGTVQKHLLQFSDGKWVDVDDEVVALEREAGPEVGGMWVLSVVKELEEDMMDFLVSAWCVTLWGEVGKRARRQSKVGKA